MNLKHEKQHHLPALLLKYLSDVIVRGRWDVWVKCRLRIMGGGVERGCPVVAPSRDGSGVWAGAPRQKVVEDQGECSVV